MKYLPITLILFLLAVGSVAAQSATHPGVQLYKDGKFKQAISSLNATVKSKDGEKNAELWNFLGLAYLSDNDFKNARKAFEKAIKLSPSNSPYHSNLAYAHLMSRSNSKARDAATKALALDAKNINAYYFRGTANLRDGKLDDAVADSTRSIEIDPAFAQGYVLKSNAIIAKLTRRVTAGSNIKAEVTLLKETVELLAAGRGRVTGSAGRAIVDEAYESVDAFYRYFSRDTSEVVNDATVVEPNVTPLKILSKPRPSYTDSARQANVQGTIQMAVLFGQNGRVEHILLLKRLGNGLDEQAVAAARRIQFQPMTRDGKAVSVVKLMEYSFSIY